MSEPIHDVAVIGGGVVGRAIARRLALGGLRCILLEKAHTLVPAPAHHGVNMGGARRIRHADSDAYSRTGRARRYACEANRLKYAYAFDGVDP